MAGQFMNTVNPQAFTKSRTSKGQFKPSKISLNSIPNIEYEDAKNNYINNLQSVQRRNELLNKQTNQYQSVQSSDWQERMKKIIFGG